MWKERYRIDSANDKKVYAPVEVVYVLWRGGGCVWIEGGFFGFQLVDLELKWGVWSPVRALGVRFVPLEFGSVPLEFGSGLWSSGPGLEVLVRDLGGWVGYLGVRVFLLVVRLLQFVLWSVLM